MDIKQHASFVWHPQTRLHLSTAASNDLQQTNSHTQDGIQFIADVDCGTSLQRLREVLSCNQTFCFHPPDYKPEPSIPYRESATHFQCLSSGTNGVPKRIQRSAQSWVQSFAVNAQLASIDHSDSYAIIGRLSHSLSLYAALEAAHLGADLHALTELRPDRQLKAIATLQSSILYATPSQLRLLCRHAHKNNAGALSVRHIFCGGGKLDQGTAARVAQVFQSAIVREFYGATETSFISITDQHTPKGSVATMLALGKRATSTTTTIYSLPVATRVALTLPIQWCTQKK